MAGEPTLENNHHPEDDLQEEEDDVSEIEGEADDTYEAFDDDEGDEGYYEDGEGEPEPESQSMTALLLGKNGPAQVDDDDDDDDEDEDYHESAETAVDASQSVAGSKRGVDELEEDEEDDDDEAEPEGKNSTKKAKV